MHHISVFNHILLSFDAQFTIITAGCFRTILYEILVGNDFRLDKSFFKVSLSSNNAKEREGR